MVNTFLFFAIWTIVLCLSCHISAQCRIRFGEQFHPSREVAIGERVLSLGTAMVMTIFLAVAQIPSVCAMLAVDWLMLLGFGGIATGAMRSTIPYQKKVVSDPISVRVYRVTYTIVVCLANMALAGFITSALACLVLLIQ